MTDPKSRQRLDVLVVERGLAETRARAQTIVMGGGISVDGVVVTKPGTAVAADARIELAVEPLPYVSRGGVKLRHALDRFDVDPRDLVACDVGASTGGFTDVLLRGGAKRVYAIDVGYGQLAWKLRTDPRVVVLERTNIRQVDTLPEPIDLAVIDVSFISLRHVLPVVRRLLRAGGHLIMLIKPQFEAGREQVGKKGVIRSAAVRAEVLTGVLGWAEDHGWIVRGLLMSPLRGPAGNVEYLAHAQAPPGAQPFDYITAIPALARAEDPAG